jgi:hypothetical protein
VRKRVPTAKSSQSVPPAEMPSRSCRIPCTS